VSGSEWFRIPNLLPRAGAPTDFPSKGRYLVLDSCLGRSHGVQVVDGSNPVAPTISPKLDLIIARPEQMARALIAANQSDSPTRTRNRTLAVLGGGLAEIESLPLRAPKDRSV